MGFHEGWCKALEQLLVFVKKNAAMKSADTVRAGKLEDIPNVGKSMAADLRAIGIHQPMQLLKQEPLSIYLQLAMQMGKRHDPCVLYTLMAARDFMQSGDARKWWTYAEAGKRELERFEKANLK